MSILEQAALVVILIAVVLTGVYVAVCVAAIRLFNYLLRRLDKLDTYTDEVHN